MAKTIARAPVGGGRTSVGTVTTGGKSMKNTARKSTGGKPPRRSGGESGFCTLPSFITIIVFLFIHLALSPVCLAWPFMQCHLGHKPKPVFKPLLPGGTDKC
jgi:hypothetical protein